MPLIADMEGPMVHRPSMLSKEEIEVVRKNIELFVDGIMDEKHSLKELLNESFSMDMLDLLFKRMTLKLRSILFTRAKTAEMVAIALDSTLPRHTRSLATSFIVAGGASSCLVTCDGTDHRCASFWDNVFGAMQREANEERKPEDAVLTVLTYELDEVIRVEVKDIEKDGAKSLQRSFVEQVAAKVEESSVSVESEDGVVEYESQKPRTPPSARTSINQEPQGSGSGRGDSPQSPTLSPSVSRVTSQAANVSKHTMVPPTRPNGLTGIFSHDTANFTSQILRYFANRGQKGACILHYIAEHPPIVDLLIANMGHDDVRTMLLHVIYSDHSDAAMASLFKSGLIVQMIDQLVTSSPPRNVFERDSLENIFLLLRELIHAPYLTARGVAISAKTIPLDKVTGQDEYVSICGASREMANSSLRKYTSRKVRHIVHLFMDHHQWRLEQLFVQMIKELTFWSSPVATRPRERRNSISSLESLESLGLLRLGHPRPTATTMLAHLFELTETVDFSEEHPRNAGPNSAAAATTVGIDCLNFMCSTHLVRKGALRIKKKLRNEVLPCELSVNCMMGLRITLIREEEPTALDNGLVHNQGNQTSITLDELESVKSSDWHEFGFAITLKKEQAAPRRSTHGHELGGLVSMAAAHDSVTNGKNFTKTVEYFAASSEEEKQGWIELLRQVINGDLNALEIFCSDDWRSNIREYRRLRECLITSMERKGHDLMVFLRQVLIENSRRASGYHLWTIVKFLNAVLSNESKRIDQMFVSAQLLAVLLTCYEKYPTHNLLLGEITKMVVFCIGDFKSKRSRRCPIIERLLMSGPEGKLLPLLTKAFVDTDGGMTSMFVRTDTLSNLKLIMESLSFCYKEPQSRSQERIQKTLQTDPAWQRLLLAVETESAKHPERSITSLPIQPTGSSPSTYSAASVASPDAPGRPVSPPAFQEHIIHQITRPAYSSAHGFGSSFLLGDGCAFGYMFKERQGGAKWQKVLLVYEYESYKLWYFYPSEVDETRHIKWKWIVPIGVRTRYTHGHDETHSSVGHHGLYVTAYEHHQHNGHSHHTLGQHNHSPASTKEVHFSVTKLEDRDQWKDVLSKAAKRIHELEKDYNAKSQHLKKPDKKTVTHCQDPSCHQPFKLFRRAHSCKRCAKWFCSKCSDQRLSIPEFGLMHPVRHCRACYLAAGGTESEMEPSHLFSGLSIENSLSISTSDFCDSVRNSFTNAELYELAHGRVSPRALLHMRRRMERAESIDSPTSSYRVDEWNDQDESSYADEEDECRSYGTTQPARYTEDTRG
ncbi:hypothetical protein Poli38472_009924 [Pythium oligandrum]|uniref:FYVE-type domain-containing protein n=1 Tax=Pythium oligandrum TaxID=41045 RepID=A0A8K1FCI9_PYTOL|nr:hypothetical protein Poli38472_009924 [Pythium oligandrum]|eukprot:TMW58365.1 hypothetical protein Poli38472_009924 [Pythium oligandrum]